MDRDAIRNMVRGMPEYRDGQLTDERVEEIVDFIDSIKDDVLHAEFEAISRRVLIKKEAQGEFRYDPETNSYYRVQKPEQG